MAATTELCSLADDSSTERRSGATVGTCVPTWRLSASAGDQRGTQLPTVKAIRFARQRKSAPELRIKCTTRKSLRNSQQQFRRAATLLDTLLGNDGT
jgi:hypothetical protein